MSQVKIIYICSKSKGKSAPQAKIFEVLNFRNTIFNGFSFKSNAKSWKKIRLRRDCFTEKNTTKNFPIRTPPVFRSGGIQGGFLIAKILLPQKCYFWTFQKTTTFWIFFIRFFFSWWFFYWDETILCLFFIRSVDFDRFFVFALSFESKNYIFRL